MLGLETWGTVISIVFIYLLLSLLGTIINEWVMMLLNARGKNLLIALETMLSDGRKKNKGLVEAFQKNPRFKKLTIWGKGLRMPSYIKTDTFVKIIIDELFSDGNSIQERFKSAEDKINHYFPEESETKTLLFSIIKQTGENLEEFEKELTSWYDNVMSRASGWYKRRVRYMLLILGMIISVIFNADTFSMIKILSSNPEAREKVVTKAEAFLAKEALLKVEVNTAPAEAPSDSAKLNSQQRTSIQNNEEYRQKIDSLYNQINTLIREDIYGVSSALGMGWNQKAVERLFNPWYNVLLSILGWFITAFAISLGAPFWFDVLIKVADIRSSGKRHTDSKS